MSVETVTEHREGGVKDGIGRVGLQEFSSGHEWQLHNEQHENISPD